MELINNVKKTLRDDITSHIKSGSRFFRVASSFSIYAFQELKDALKGIKELRFIFTSPTFTAEQTPSQKREIYIPQLDRERSLYGSIFEKKTDVYGAIFPFPHIIIKNKQSSLRLYFQILKCSQ